MHRVSIARFFTRTTGFGSSLVAIVNSFSQSAGGVTSPKTSLGVATSSDCLRPGLGAISYFFYLVQERCCVHTAEVWGDNQIRKPRTPDRQSCELLRFATSESTRAGGSDFTASGRPRPRHHNFTCARTSIMVASRKQLTAPGAGAGMSLLGSSSACTAPSSNGARSRSRSPSPGNVSRECFTCVAPAPKLLRPGKTLIERTTLLAEQQAEILVVAMA